MMSAFWDGTDDIAWTYAVPNREMVCMETGGYTLCKCRTPAYPALHIQHAYHTPAAYPYSITCTCSSTYPSTTRSPAPIVTPTPVPGNTHAPESYIPTHFSTCICLCTCPSHASDTTPKPDDQPKEEVLARSGDDKWYYKGYIVASERNNSYRVWYLTDYEDSVLSKNIIRISDQEVIEKLSEKACYVLAPHPVYPWSYAPGCVVDRDGDRVSIKFYDGQESKDIRNSEIYPNSSHDKHWKDVKAIKKREKEWEGKSALIRNDSTGFYEEAKVIQKLDRDQKYQVELDSGTQEQSSIHIYGEYSRPYSCTGGKYILAGVDKKKYLPGRVTVLANDSLTVEFVNGQNKSIKDIPTKHRYWMNERYYQEAREFFLELHPEFKQDGSE